MSRTSTSPAGAEAGEAELEVARWLVEVGRRKPAGAAREEPPAVPARSGGSSLHRVVLLGVFAAALFQYVYLDTLLDIASLHSLIVFVFTGSHG